VFIYALVGMQLFANRLHFDRITGVHIDIEDTRYAMSIVPRHNFDTLSTAVTTVFQVLSGENWNEVMYDCWKATAWISPLYFVSLVILGIFIVLNLFLAILLKQFDSGDDVEAEGKNLNSLPETSLKSETKLNSMISALRDTTEMLGRSIINATESFTNCGAYRELRNSCIHLVRDKRFEAALTFSIILSSLALSLDNPLSDPSTPFATSLEMTNLLFTIIFMFEFLIKIFSYGLVDYFVDTWNILDFSAVIASLVEVLNVGRGKSLRAMRTLRVLRPLKMVHRFPEIKLVGKML
jgi:voltage-dependent calcium channel L type alpha-1D